MSSRSSSGSDADPLIRLAARLGRGGEAALGDLALERGWVTESQLMECERDLETGRASGPLDRLLMDRGFLSGAQAAELKAAAPHRDVGRIASGLAPETPAEAEEASRDPARRFGRYVLVQEMGQGAMGVVYRAWQTDLGRWVALKRLKVEGAMAVARFLREGRLAARVVHPHLVPIYDMGVVGDEPYLAMALIEGHHLEGQRLREPQALRAIEGVAGAVEAIHAAGILHRDIKPGNLLRDAAGRVFLGDFGLARQEESAPALSRSGQLIGTPAYASPEQLRGELSAVGPRSDVYSLGATLFALLTGRPPFTGGDALEVARKVLESDPPVVPGPAGAIVVQAMDRDPARRYPSAHAFAQDVARALAGKPPAARPPGWTRRMRLGLRRRRTLLAGLGGALLVAAALSAALWTQSGRWRSEVDRQRRARDLEGSWRDAEAAAREILEWAEIRFRTQPPTDPERTARRGELVRALARWEGAPQVPGTLLARYDYLTGRLAAADAEFARLAAAHPDDPSVAKHRALTRLTHALTALPAPYFSLSSGGGAPVIVTRGPVAELRALTDSVATELRALPIREGVDPFVRGIRAYLDQRYVEAIAELEAAAGEPALADASLEVLGCAWLARGDYARSAEIWERGLERTPRRADLRRVRAGAIAALGRQRSDPALLEKGIVELDRALEVCPSWSDAHSFRGTLKLGLAKTLLERGENPARALAAYRGALEDFRTGRAGGDDDAATAINEASAEMSLADTEARIDGRDPEPGLRRALGLLDAVRVPETERDRGLIQATLHRNRAGVLLILAQRRLAQAPADEVTGLLRRSIAEFGHALKTSETDRAILFVYRGVAQTMLAWLESDRGLLPSARADMDAGVALDPRSVKFRQQIAGSVLQTGRWMQDAEMLNYGLRHASEALSLDPQGPVTWITRSDLYLALAGLEKNPARAAELAQRAVEDLGRALELHSSSMARLRRSYAHAKLAELNEARPEVCNAWLAKSDEDAREASRLDPASADALFQIGAVLRMRGDEEGGAEFFRRARDLPTCSAELRARIDERLREMGQ